ncbi:DNA-binding CsgD family transcriptional regulator [Methylorubrum rhodinum]|uniref:DNA-binding CsgD family transcriptional regulator n=1 Tax=Methylorubrum rhodinum TaxID=29428 RepID=A0A840ZGR8_9HYPH|nr:LuxR family transcriptional regulator [Methylorubrum rhodinum]MBB5757202.1 DNA-binding CsgD family transcriptional regulator [Methylorubrum rhodinum]
MKRDLSLTETLDALAAAPHLDALNPILLDLRDAYGLANVVYHATHLPACLQPNPILMLSYDPGWVSRYVGEDYFALDPVVQAGRTGFLPIDWDGLDRTSVGARHVFKEADSYGVGRRGITIPIRGPNGERAIFTLTSNITLDDWVRNKPTYLREYHAVAHFFHERAVQLSGLRAAQPRRLSRREQQCVQFLALGRQAKTIAYLLDISEPAVRLYLRTARHKLGCATMTQLVARAIALDLIDA